MSVCKIEFVDNKTVEVYTIDKDGVTWMVANPFAEALGYHNCANAIAKFVSRNNQKIYEEIKPPRIEEDDSSVQLIRNFKYNTKFINRAGVFELINSSEMPAAKRFKSWNNNDLLPTLCQEGEYNMVKDAPNDIVEGMNAVHVATNEGEEAPWMKDLNDLKKIINQKDKMINNINQENKNLTIALTESNNKIINMNQNLIIANKGLLQAVEMINEARKETAQLANRMVDMSQDVIAKPSNPQLLHALAVCSMGGDQYAFLRPQRKSLKRSLDRLSIQDKDIVFKSDYVPNAVNVLNKVKENLPKEKYMARNNKITLLEDLTKEDLVEAINSSLCQRQVAKIANTIDINI
ncbi:baculovirus repeated ORF e [Orgyia leucostigma nucleopolyhedrovirus]|uniref:Baculovirus repeated ORF e n=1 Tax=Orgyia leucostigma nucleopolyhedrovirus TaxID=490711 RepID=B0FDW8_9ABAC|nr:baculovirus repeated ORF e [Orgyia leucostigma nucleopolyhedrovirus]ABY65826.1 baculovirus repeated ORF e [Orgyia leucostigma nucleopolyhedrovirus]